MLSVTAFCVLFVQHVSFCVRVLSVVRVVCGRTLKIVNVVCDRVLCITCLACVVLCLCCVMCVVCVIRIFTLCSHRQQSLGISTGIVRPPFFRERTRISTYTTHTSVRRRMKLRQYEFPLIHSAQKAISGLCELLPQKDLPQKGLFEQSYFFRVFMRFFEKRCVK